MIQLRKATAEPLEFHQLQIISPDTLAPGEGYETHAHTDIEIVTLVLEGQLKHIDSTGAESDLHAGDVQSLSAGTGVQHSEFNTSENEKTKLVQLWITPSKNGGAPSYDRGSFFEGDKLGKFCLIASSTGEQGSVKIKQPLRIFSCILKAGQKAEFIVPFRRYAYVHLASGKMKMNDLELSESEGARITPEDQKPVILKFQGADGKSEFLVIDLF